MNIIYLTACAIVIMVMKAFSHNLPQADSIFVKNRPQIFASGIISLENRFETYPAFTPDGKEIYFSVVNADWTEGKILYSKARDGQWTEPKTAVFSDNKYVNWESSISPDGKKQYFSSNRPPSSGMDIWMVERTTDSTWSDPVHLKAPANSEAEDGSACVTNNGTLYFKSLRGGGIGGSWLYSAKRKGGSYSLVESLGNHIKTRSQETELFMAPDESYGIFTSKTRSGGYGGWDLWICFHQPDNSWTEPTNMGSKINTADDEYGPRVSPYGNFLLFTRENRGKTMDIYWVEIGVVENTEKLKNKLNNEY